LTAYFADLAFNSNPESQLQIPAAGHLRPGARLMQDDALDRDELALPLPPR
jgi:hypothetical protein